MWQKFHLNLTNNTYLILTAPDHRIVVFVAVADKLAGGVLQREIHISFRQTAVIYNGCGSILASMDATKQATDWG